MMDFAALTTEELRAVKGTIFNIQHYCIHDGPGIRTNVFIKGCPLRCIWCANPESQNVHPQLMFRLDKCSACGACIPTCPENAISLKDGKIINDRSLCKACGACVSVCPNDAREIMGKTVTVGEVFDEVEGDALFYGDDGGITVTGGEALAHPEFTGALLTLCRRAGINTAVETCGQVKWEIAKPILALCDTVLYDNKQMDSELHRKFTGAGNELILSNLKKINDELDCDIWVRVPTIPFYNADKGNIEAAAGFVKENIPHCVRFDLLPYHNMGESKAEQLDAVHEGFHSETPSKATMTKLKDLVRSFGLYVQPD